MTTKKESASTPAPKPTAFDWLKDRSLTLALLGIFLAFWIGQVAAGFNVFNDDRKDHHQPPVTLSEYFQTGTPFESTMENWESEFLEMAVFVMLTVVLVQKGSAESRRPGAIELVDADPRHFRKQPDVPWPVKSGGWILWLYERSLGLAFLLLFALAWTAHLITGRAAEAAEKALDGLPPPTLTEFLTSSKFWFQSFQNWQSEFIGIAAMVWLSVYLRHRGSPESKPVHASYDETGR